MKRYLPHISATLILIAVIAIGFGHVAQAQTPGTGGCNIFNWNTNNCVIDVLGSIVNGVLGIASWILALSGYVLNFSMKLTLNIKTFVDNTGAIYLVWKSIRDISGMFIIFTLLFAAIKMILAPIGVPGPSVGKLITTVVMAGILINFSFFIAGLGIDVSNVVSAQLYKVIAPESNISGDMKVNPSTLRDGLDGGISDIFMSSLKIQKLYENGLAKDPNSSDSQGAVVTTIKVIWAGVIGIIIMLTSAASFLLAALSFIVRFVILIFLLGFSPIWLAAYAIPDLKKYADQWTEVYKGQLLFMPIYLLLLYFGLNVLSNANLFWSGNFAGASWQENLLVFSINAVFVIIMLNAPLVAAISIGGKVNKWMDRGLGAGAIWKKVGVWTGRNTAGRAGHMLDNSDAMKGLQASKYTPVRAIGNTLSKQAGTLGNYGFGEKKAGFKDTVEADAKKRGEIHKKVSEVDKTRYDQSTWEGKQALIKAEKEARERGEKYREIMNETILSSLMQKTARTTNKGVWAATGAAAEAMNYAASQGVPGMDKATEVMIKGAEKATQAISTAPGALGANLAGRKAAAIVDKKNKDEKAKKDGKDAEDAKKAIDDAFSAWNLEHTRESQDLKNKIDDLGRGMESLEKDAQKLTEAIEKDKGINNLGIAMGKPSTTRAQEASLANIQTTLTKMKTDKLAYEKRMLDISNERVLREKEDAIKKRELQKKIDARKAVEESEKSQGLKSDLEKAIKDNAPKDSAA